MKFLATALGLLILISFGCQRSSKPVNVDRQVEWAYHLIDQGNYNAAIELFQQLLHQEDNPTIRIGLASAYAARAGIIVHAYWDLVLPSVKVPPPATLEATQVFRKQWEDRINLLPGNLQKQFAGRTEEIVVAHAQVETLKWRFHLVPLLVSPEQQRDILLAREIIKGIPTRGTHLYRSLLSLILLRYEAEKVSGTLQASLTTNAQWPCSAPLREWLQQVPSLFSLVSEVLADLKMAYPTKQMEMVPFERDLENYRSHFIATQSLLETALCSNQQ